MIKLSPEKSEELYYIKNWRPLTLLNYDYKIATKAIVNHLKTHLHKLINNDQTGFLKGRFIGENIHLVDRVINYTAAKKFLNFYFSLTLRTRLTHWNGLSYKKHLFVSDLAPPLSNGLNPFITTLKAVL